MLTVTEQGVGSPRRQASDCAGERLSNWANDKESSAKRGQRLCPELNKKGENTVKQPALGFLAEVIKLPHAPPTIFSLQ